MRAPRHLVPIVPLLAVLLVGACGGGGGGTPPEETSPQVVRRLEPGPWVQISQVDFHFDASVTPNSAWGRVVVDPAALQAHLGVSGGYVNVVTDAAWAVVNLPVPPIEEGTLATYFDLGILDGEELEVLPVHVVHGVHPIGEILPHLQEPDVYVVERWTRAANGAGLQPSEAAGPPPPTVPREQVVPVGEETFVHYQQVTNVQCAENQCYPMAVANALQFLENTGAVSIPHPHVLGIWGDGSLVGNLDVECGRVVTDRQNGNGVYTAQAAMGTFNYLHYESLALALAHSHQDRGNEDLTPYSLAAGTYTHQGISSPEDAGTVTWSWLEDRLLAGCGIVVSHAYGGGGGHAMRVTAVGRVNGQPWIRYSHDAWQSNNDTSDTQGLENVGTTLTDIDGDGKPNMGAWAWNLRFAHAHCP